MATSFTKLRLRRGKKEQWTQYNTILDAGELGFEEDTYRFKIGQINPATGELYDWNNLDYFGDTFQTSDITIDGQVNLTDQACFNGDVIPCADDVFTIGDAARRWKELHASRTIKLGDIELTQGPASPATGVDQNFLKINGDDIATRTELEKVTTTNLRLQNPTDPLPTYIYTLFDILERALPPMENISTQSQFNGWVIAALEHVDEVAHQNSGSRIEGDSIIIDGDDLNVIIGPGPGGNCEKKLDIYNETTVHCMLDAKKGVKVLDADETHFVKANGTVSDQVPLVQSYWNTVPRL